MADLSDHFSYHRSQVCDDDLHGFWLEVMEGPPWRQQAACNGMDPEMFFAERGDWVTVSAAKSVCAACPVRADCLELGMTERDGIWGGLSGHERRRLHRRSRYKSLRAQDWCSPCASGSHPECRGAGCACPACAGLRAS